MHAEQWPLARPPFRAQAEAIRRGWDRDGFNFYMEQGLGKSATTLANFEILRRKGEVRKLLIVSPNSFKAGWVSEIKKAGISLPVAVWSPDRRDRFLKTVRDEKEWIAIVNYESLARLADDYVKVIAGQDVMIAADESIKMKNPRSLQSRAALFLGDHCGVQRNLSGKPVTQGPHDLWAQLKFIRRVKKMNFYAFRNNFCQMGGYLGKQVVGARNEEEMQALLNSCSFMARKKDWTDLPDKLDPITVPVDMVGDQRTMYKQMEKDFITSLDDSSMVSVEQVITRDIKLRQIMSGFIMDEEGGIREFMPFKKNPRFKATVELLEDTINGKAVIVTWYKHTMDSLLRNFEEMGYKPAFIRGRMRDEEIEEQKRRFNEEDDCRVIVVQQVAAKYGHTLLGTPGAPCSSMIFFEQSYSLDDRSQIEDRIHRYGQVWPCSYFDFSMSRLDRACVRALQRKESVAAAVLGYKENKDTLDEDEAYLRGVMA